MREKIVDIIRKPQMMYHPQIGLNFTTYSKEGAETIVQEILTLIKQEIEKVRKGNPNKSDGSGFAPETHRRTGYDEACQAILEILK